MARGTRNSLSNPTTTLSGAIGIGAATAPISAVTTEMPDDGSTFSVNIGNTVVDQEVIDCTYTGTTLTFVGVTTKAHADGAPVNIVWTQADYDNFAKQDNTNTFTQETITQGIQTRTGGLAIPSGYIGGASAFATETISFAAGATGKYIQISNLNGLLGGLTYPTFFKNQNTGEIFSAASFSGGYLFSGCERGLFGTAKEPMAVSDVIEIHLVSNFGIQMDGSELERLAIDFSATGIIEIKLPDYTVNSIPDGKVYYIGDYYGTLDIGSALVLTDPVSGRQVYSWDKNFSIQCIFDATGVWSFTKSNSVEVAENSPEKYVVRAASISSLTTSYTSGSVGGTFTNIDGVTPTAGDLILLKNESTASRNGVYEYNSSTNMSRIDEFDSSGSFIAGLVFYVSEGNTNKDSTWVLNTNNPIIIDTTSLNFTRVSGNNNVLGKTADYTVTVVDDKQTIAYTTLAGARTVTLPAISAVDDGFSIWVLDATTGTHASTNNLTIQRTGSDLFVGGGTNTVINTANGWRQIIKLNSRWMVISTG